MTYFLPLVDGQVVVFHGQGEHGHGSGVDLAGAVFRTTAMPRTVPALELEYDVLHLLAGDLRVVATPLVHALGIVVGAVEEKFSPRVGFVVDQPIGGPLDKR